MEPIDDQDDPFFDEFYDNNDDDFNYDSETIKEESEKQPFNLDKVKDEPNESQENNNLNIVSENLSEEVKSEPAIEIRYFDINNKNSNKSMYSKSIKKFHSFEKYSLSRLAKRVCY